MSIHKKLKQLRLEKNLSMQEAGKRIGVSWQTIQQWEKEDGSGTAPKRTRLDKVAEFYGVTASLLLDDEQQFSPVMKKNINNEVSQVEENLQGSGFDKAPKLGEYRRIAVVGTAQLGDNGYWAELEYPVGYGDGYVNYPSRDPLAYALRCKGDSMKPRIKDGEFVIIEPSVEYSPGDEVLVKCKEGRVMIKELLYIRDGAAHLGSINESHPKIVIQMTDIEVIHYVAATARKSKWDPE